MINATTVINANKEASTTKTEAMRLSIHLAAPVLFGNQTKEEKLNKSSSEVLEDLYTAGIRYSHLVEKKSPVMALFEKEFIALLPAKTRQAIEAPKKEIIDMLPAERKLRVSGQGMIVAKKRYLTIRFKALEEAINKAKSHDGAQSADTQSQSAPRGTRSAASYLERSAKFAASILNAYQKKAEPTPQDESVRKLTEQYYDQLAALDSRIKQSFPKQK